MEVLRGEIYLADLSPVIGSEQGGVRPVLVVQNNIGNRFSPTVVVVALTSRLTKAQIPTHVEISGGEFGLSANSIILCEQIRTIDKRRLKLKLGMLNSRSLSEVDRAIKISLGTN